MAKPGPVSHYTELFSSQVVTKQLLASREACRDAANQHLFQAPPAPRDHQQTLFAQKFQGQTQHVHFQSSPPLFAVVTSLAI